MGATPHPAPVSRRVRLVAVLSRYAHHDARELARLSDQDLDSLYQQARRIVQVPDTDTDGER